MQPIHRILLVLTMGTMIFSPAIAQQTVWQTNGAPIANSSDGEYLNFPTASTNALPNMNITRDEVGGTIVCWASNSGGSYYINAQRIGRAGVPMWTNVAGGIRVGASTGTDGYRTSQAVTDGAGGAYIAWTGQSSTNGQKQFIQHVDATGTLLWGSAGYTLTPTDENALAPADNASLIQMQSDVAGGVIITYYTFSTDKTTGTLHVARLFGSGNAPQFAITPVAALTFSNNETFNTSIAPVIISDDAGGAIVAAGSINTNSLYCSRIVEVNSRGSVAYNLLLTQDTYAPDATSGFHLVSNNAGGSLFTYTLSYNDTIAHSNQTYVASINSAGQISWGPTLAQNAGDDNQTSPRVAIDGSGGEFLVLVDGAYGTGMVLQHVDKYGTLSYNTSGTPAGISLDGAGESYAQIISDEAGNAICAWAQGGSVYVQKYLGGGGSASWSASSLSVSTAGTAPILTGDGVGGVFIAWNNNSDVSVQHVVDTTMAPHGLLGSNALAYDPLRVGATVATKYVQLSNTAGHFPLAVYGVTSTNGQTRVKSQTFPFTLDVGNMSNMFISFTPSVAGPNIDTLVFTTNDFISGSLFVAVSGNGIYPHLDAVNTLGFADVSFNPVFLQTSSTTDTLSINNTGSENLVISRAAIVSGNALEFTFDSHLFPMTIAPGGTTLFPVTFAPMDSAGVRVAKLQFMSNYDSLNPFNITLNASAHTIAPNLQAASSFDAGAVLVGSYDTTRYVVLNDAAATDNLIISKIDITGQFATSFTILNAPAFPDTVLPGKSVVLKIQFHPTTGGTLLANVRIVSNASPAPAVIPIFAQANVPLLYAAALDFGKVKFEGCKVLPLTIANLGTAVLNVTSITFTGSRAQEISVANGATLSLQPGSSGAIPVQFCPSTRGSRTVIAHINSAEGYTFDVPITGWGGLNGNLSAPSDVSFGTVTIRQPITQTISIFNVGETPTILTGLTYTGATPVMFNTSIKTPTTVKPGDSLFATVTLKALTPGIWIDTLTIQTSDSASLTLVLTGIATEHPLTNSVSQLFTDTIAVGLTDTQSVSITNITRQTQQISGYSILGPDASSYQLVDGQYSWPVDVSPMASTGIAVVFNPAHGARTYLATLVLRVASGDSMMVDLKGTASSPTGVETAATMPGTVTLAQNAPNPFNASTRIAFTLPASASVSLVIYDALGREVARMIDGVREAGVNAVDLAAHQLPVGMYSYQLRVNGTTQSRMMQIVR